MRDIERRQLLESLISEVQIYEDRQFNGQWLKSIKFRLPVLKENMNIDLDTDPHDKPCNPSYFRKQFREALEFVGDVRVLPPHCCRHTYVSQMQALGVDLPTIQSIVGHADIDMTRHYLHVQAPIRQQAIDKFKEAFESKTEETQ